MAKRSGLYVGAVCGSEMLSFDEVVALAADTGTDCCGMLRPLLETVVEMLDELGRPDEYL